MIYLLDTKDKDAGPSLLLVPFITCIVYLLTLAPGITWSHWGIDGGDFIVAVVKESLPHPPGFPLYLALARLITVIPLDTVAFRMNLLSALMATGAVFFTALTLREKQLTKWSTFAAPLSLSFAPLFWSQALITEVYTSAAFFISLSLYLCTREVNRKTSALTSGVAWGLALAVHPTTALAALHFWFGRKKVWNGIITGILLSVFLYASLLFWNNRLQRWADFGTLRGWFEYVSGRLYWDYAFSLPIENLPRRIISWITLYSQQFTPAGAVLVVVGILQMWRTSWKTALGFLLAVSVITLYAIFYNSIDSFIYLVPILPIFIPFLGQGMDWIIKRGIPGIVLLLLPTILLVSHWQTISLKKDTAVDSWLWRTASQTPVGAVLITKEDNHTFTLWYAQEVTGYREDIIVVDKRLWAYPPYQRFITDTIGEFHTTIATLGESWTLCAVEDKGVVCQ